MTNETQKPDFDEWFYWAQIVIDRLSICIDTYSRPPHEDIFLPERDRQYRNFQAADLLKRLFAVTDESDTPSDSLDELNHHAERVIDGLVLLFRETLRLLPLLSRDMQKLLASPWDSKFPTRIAENLFRGSLSTDGEGIGSGLPENGRLPGVLTELLRREQTGEGRALRHEILGKHMLQDDFTRRWNVLQGSHLRQAGRIE